MVDLGQKGERSSSPFSFLIPMKMEFSSLIFKLKVCKPKCLVQVFLS